MSGNLKALGTLTTLYRKKMDVCRIQNGIMRFLGVVVASLRF
jgi:hypothetical protein